MMDDSSQKWLSVRIVLNVQAPEQLRWTSSIRFFHKKEEFIVISHASNGIDAVMKVIEAVVIVDSNDNDNHDRWRDALVTLANRIDKHMRPTKKGPR